MNQVQAVLFDLDDTLLNRAETFSRYCDYLIDIFYVPARGDSHRQEVKDFMLQADKGGYESREVFYGKVIERLNLTLQVEDLENEWFRSFDRFAVPADDLMRVLTTLRAEYPLGIVTNGSVSMQNRKIDALGIRSYFQVITISGEVGVRKPDPKIFLLTCEVLGVPASSTVYIGDHYQKDIMGATNAGLSAIWLDMRAQDLPYPHRVDRLASVLDLLESNRPK